jgi:hypothetical protein
MNKADFWSVPPVENLNAKFSSVFHGNGLTRRNTQAGDMIPCGNGLKVIYAFPPPQAEVPHHPFARKLSLPVSLHGRYDRSILLTSKVC